MQRQHQRMAVDNAGAGRQQRRNTGQLGLQHLRLLGTEPFQIVHPVGCGLGLDGLQLRNLRRVCGNNEFAAALVGNAPLGAVGVQQLLACHTQARLQRTLRVINARMDHLAVAGAGARANRISSLQHNDFTPL